MKRDEILEVLRSLAMGQGFYGRLLNSLDENSLAYLEAQNFKDEVDLVLFLED